MELGGHGFWRRRPFTPLYPHPLSRPSPSSQSRLSHNAKSAEGKFDCAEESILLTHKFSHARWSGQTHKRERGGTGNSIWNSIWGTKDDRFRWVRAHLAFRPSDLPLLLPRAHSASFASKQQHRGKCTAARGRCYEMAVISKKFSVLISSSNMRKMQK